MFLVNCWFGPVRIRREVKRHQPQNDAENGGDHDNNDEEEEEENDEVNVNVNSGGTLSRGFLAK